jgi:hypothetical protein
MQKGFSAKNFFFRAAAAPILYLRFRKVSDVLWSQFLARRFTADLLALPKLEEALLIIPALL